jgi:hypothetical protein
MLAAHLQAVAYRFQTDFMATLALLDTITHIFGN